MSLLNKNIFLIGMPGSGKSTVGHTLAERLQMSFIDLDHEIERNAGMLIKEIFAVHGEDHFRQLEKEALQNVVRKCKSTVVATGGGAPCFFDNIDVIRENGVSIFIDVPIPELVSRINVAERDKRPKFSKGVDLTATLSQLIKQRMPFYKKANYRWDGMNQDELERIIEKLVAQP